EPAVPLGEHADERAAALRPPTRGSVPRLALPHPGVALHRRAATTWTALPRGAPEPLRAHGGNRTSGRRERAAGAQPRVLERGLPGPASAGGVGPKPPALGGAASDPAGRPRDGGDAPEAHRTRRACPSRHGVPVGLHR